MKRKTKTYLYLPMPLTALMRFDEYFPTHRRRDALSKRLKPLDRIVFYKWIWQIYNRNYYINFQSMHFFLSKLKELKMSIILYTIHLISIVRWQKETDGRRKKNITKSNRRPPGFFVYCVYMFKKSNESTNTNIKRWNEQKKIKSRFKWILFVCVICWTKKPINSTRFAFLLVQSALNVQWQYPKECCWICARIELK